MIVTPTKFKALGLNDVEGPLLHRLREAAALQHYRFIWHRIEMVTANIWCLSEQALAMVSASQLK